MASKLSTFKKITQDIQEQSIQDNFTLENMNDTMSNLFTNIKSTSGRLGRVMSQNSSMTRMIVIGVVAFFVFYTLVKFL